MAYLTARHRQPLTCIVACCLAAGLAARCSQAQVAFRGFWADAWSPGFKDMAEIDAMVQRAAAGNYNAIVAEVLAFQDAGGTAHGAYWNSAIVPKAGGIGGDIDPLAYLCEQARPYGIEVHAWLVAYRVSSSWPPAGNDIITAHPEWIMVAGADMGGGPATIGGNYTLDPGSPGAQEYLVSIVRELVTEYPIDGINWDYIRYTQYDAGYPSDTTYENSGLKRFQRIYNTTRVPAATGDWEWDDFRRRTIDELIRRCRAEIPAIKTNPRQPLRHTADLFATYYAPSSFTSSQAYRYFQNWALWMEQGWLDAAMPMNYKREHCSDQATMYRTWIDKIVTTWRYDRHAYCGQGNYLNGMANSVTQLQYVYNQGAEGSMNYEYYSTRSSETVCENPKVDNPVNDWSWYTYVASSIFTSPVSTPTMPWRDPATATEGTLWGRVTDFATGEPVDDATVTVYSRPSVQTDGNGYYTVTLISATAQGTERSVTISKSGLPAASHPGALVLAGALTRYDFSLGAPPPEIELDVTSIYRTVEIGNDPPDESFTVTAASGHAPLNYTLTDDAAWLSVSPGNGVSTGEADSISISYDVASLPDGTYNGTITVADAAASNNPQTIPVTVWVKPPGHPCDYDRDGDVDQTDFGHVQVCLSGDSIPQDDPDCQDAKFDGDSDVDQDDVLKFLGCMSGAGVPSDPDCLNP